jgi:hypothetical protein
MMAQERNDCPPKEKENIGSLRRVKAEYGTVDVFGSSHFHTRYERQGRGPNLLMQRRCSIRRDIVQMH